MIKGQNFNRPEKGSQIKVQPITDLKAIAGIKALLADRPRDLALFMVGINTALRASDLLRITVGQVRHLKAGDDLELVEQKTGKARRITLNSACVEAIQGLLNHYAQSVTGPVEDVEYLFQGQRTGNDGPRPLTVPYLNALVKSWCKALRLKGNYGSHTLRKTFGYHQRKTFCIDVVTLMTVFNHASPKQTLAYLCIQPDEVKHVYMNAL